MSLKLIGRFFFKKTDTGNLIGEWSNNNAPDIYTESSDLQNKGDEKDKLKFEGTYFSTWQEKGKPKFAELNITHKDCKYFLLWENEGKKIFYGEGMLMGGMLIGDYREKK